MVFPANVSKTWPHVAPLLARAVERMKTHDTEDVRKMILSGNAHLWIQWSDGADAAGVTQFINYPKGLWLRIWLAGARDGVKVLWPEFQKHIIEFAHANNCAGIRHEGRNGWMKLHAQINGVDSEMVMYNYLLPKRSLV